ncbi:glycoside hydrolase family protein [Flagellimonas sp. HMM57]|uniref:glycoside hydrolase family protein n=1 Tax=unclassified Flagellimonas TaxID=2644544 RepID=UPI0013CFFBC2|nr:MULTISPECIES: glycoside hydrolase family protein [unclassified Flagellimonas]UII75353.1 glycoside hydrolase family protein [Flagellimonas sp. HMM57]
MISSDYKKRIVVNRNLFGLKGIFLVCLLVACGQKENELNLGAMVQPVSDNHIKISQDYHIWGASVVKGYDGKYHMYYSRWKYELGHMGWVTDSEIAYAVADKAEGPYVDVNVALPARGKAFWDGTTTHNPNIIKVDGQYYLYYMGTTSSVEAVQPTSMKNKDWWIYRNNQRIGVAWSDKPEGPWNRFDEPVIDIDKDPKALDALAVNNPAVNIGPDGKIFAVYKVVAKTDDWKPVDMENNDTWHASKGGRVRFLAAFADSPLGPFTKHEEPIFELKESEDGHMFAEDPYVWSQDGKYYALVTDIKGLFTGDTGAIALMESDNGYDWVQSKYPLVVPGKILKADGTRTEYKIERPQLLVEDGTPTFLFGALGITVDGVHRGHACNLRIPLNSSK